MRFLIRYLVFMVALSAGTKGICAQELVFTSIEQTPLTHLLEERIRKAYLELGYSIRVTVVPSRRALTLANDGYFDGELFRIAGVSSDHPHLLRVPYPLARGRLLAVTLDETIQDWDPEAVGERLVGIRRGILIAEKATAGLNTIKLNDFQQMLDLLRAGRIEIGIIAEIGGLLSMPPEQIDSVRLLPTPVATFKLYHYVHERHKALVPQLSEMLERASEARAD